MSSAVTDLTRELILRTAEEIVEAKTVAALTMTEVATRSGLSRSTVHRYFPSRIALLAAVDTTSQTNGDVGEQQTGTDNGDPSAGSGKLRILNAAHDVFVDKGYDGTTIKEIADKANLTEAMVYRYFGSKRMLFEHAAVIPLVEFMTSYVGRYDSQTWKARAFVDEAIEFCGSLYDVLHAERDLLFTVLAARRFNAVASDPEDPVARAFARVLDLMTDVLGTQASARQLQVGDRSLIVSFVFGMVLSLAVYDDWLLASRPYSRDEIIQEMARVLVYGVGGPRGLYGPMLVDGE